MKISHLMSISKILIDLCVIRQSVKKKKKKHFCEYCLQCFCSENVLVEHKETCLEINDKQTVKLRSDSIKFENYFKQLFVAFNIYTDFECNVKRVTDRNNNTSCTEKYPARIPCSFDYKVVCVEGKIRFIDSLKQFLVSMIIAKKL